ncbi:MAG: lipopolysaccharide transport system ATP-binding protein [Gaiellaceae bacterium]|nr:lipopolysaccharide transport system ATP-binding protein [Gaiellaceae bacterium]
MPSSSEPAPHPRGSIRGRGLSRHFELRDQTARSLKEVLITRRRVARRELWALRDVDIDVMPGESFGIVGQNGSGKSTLLKLIAGIYPPTEGELHIEGRIGSLLEVGAGFHPDFSGRENVYLNAAVFGISRDYVDAHLDEIIVFAELEEFADQAVKTYSSGMYLRLGFSVAMHINPDILLLDEVLAVGDEAFQQKCQGRIWDFKRGGGTIVFVSHDATSVERLCDRAMLLEKGRVVEAGTPEEVLRTYHRHLAARAVSAIPRPDTAAPPGAVQILGLRAISGDGTIRTRFIEGEPLVLETTVLADTGAESVQFTLAFRDAAGQLVAARTHPAVALRAGIPEQLRFHLEALPFRDGVYRIDLSVVSHDGDQILAEEERALELSIFSNEPGGAGPVRLVGAWEVPVSAPPVER